MIAENLLASISLTLIAVAHAEYDVAKYCKLVIDGTKLPSTDSCQEHYTCLENGKVVSANCSGTTVFSKNAQQCVPERATNCFYGLANPCEFRNDKFVRSSEGCNIWHYCANGTIAGSGTCLRGQIFDAASSRCVYGDCTSNSNNDADVRNLCEIMPDGIFFGDFKDCSKWFKCSGMTMKSGNCENDLVFDTKTGMCLQNDGNMCERTNNVIIIHTEAGGPPSTACTNVSQIVGDTKICSIYYTCKVSAENATANEWVQSHCDDNQYFDVISKQCSATSLARAYPGCDRCQFTQGNPYWANAVDAKCSIYITCNFGKRVGGSTQRSCGPGNFFDENSQYCIEGNSTLSQYAINNGACQNYSCNNERACTVPGENSDDSNNSGAGSGEENASGSNGDRPSQTDEPSKNENFSEDTNSNAATGSDQ